MLLIQPDLFDGGGHIKQTRIVRVLGAVIPYLAQCLLRNWLMVETHGTRVFQWAMGNSKVYDAAGGLPLETKTGELPDFVTQQQPGEAGNETFEPMEGAPSQGVM